jgi:hypothetical protein
MADVKDVLREWLADHPEMRQALACAIENFAVEIRKES